MRFLDTDEAKKNCENFYLKNEKRFVEFETVRILLPTEFGKLLSLTRILIVPVLIDHECLVILDSAGIWPSWEDRNLYRLMRQALGGSAEWTPGAGHLLSSAEKDNLITLIQVFANFRWDFRIIASTGLPFVEFSHDDWCDVNLKSARDKLPTLEALGLKFDVRKGVLA